MINSHRVRFFNFFRCIFKWQPLERILVIFTNGKGYDNIFVKCIPQNYQYKKNTYRTVLRSKIYYRLDISEYMEWVIYFGLTVEEREGLYPLVKQHAVIMDIGTNIGETLLNFAFLTGEKGMVYGFEPVQENYDKCLANISLNKFSNLLVSRVALSDKHEILFFGTADNKNSGGIFMNKELQESGVSVQAVTLDEFTAVNQIMHIDLIKIDVEGFEYNVLVGAEKTIRSCNPVLFVEVDEVNLQRQGSSSNKLLELIYSFNYTVRKANGSSMDNKNESHYDVICEPVLKVN